MNDIEFIQFLTEVIQKIEETTSDKISFKIGKYIGQYPLDCANEWCTITGDIYIRANYDTLFEVIDENLNIVDNFDIIDNEAIIKIDEKLDILVWYRNYINGNIQ